MKYKYLLFDLDGTVCDTSEGIYDGITHALKSVGREAGTQDELNWFIGPPLRYSFSNFCDMTEGEVDLAVAAYRKRYSDGGVYKNRIFPGMRELLAECQRQGAKIALATSKPTVFAKMILEQHEITDFFDVIVGSEFDGTRDEKTEVIAEVVRLLGLEQSDMSAAVMIGDRDYDILGGKSFDMASVGVAFGFAPEGELEAAGADFVAADAGDLLNYLL